MDLRNTYLYNFIMIFSRQKIQMQNVACIWHPGRWPNFEALRKDIGIIFMVRNIFWEKYFPDQGPYAPTGGLDKPQRYRGGKFEKRNTSYAPRGG